MPAEFVLLRVPYRVRWRREKVNGRPRIATEEGTTVPLEFEHPETARRYVEAQNAAHPDRWYWVVPGEP